MAKFKPGVSGNPSGRPRGIPNPSTRLRAAIVEDLPEIIAVLRQQALGGDVGAARLLMERALPALRPEVQAEPVRTSATTLGERTEAVVAATLAGELTPTTGTELVSLLAQQARITELVDFERRLAALEESHHEANPGNTA